MSFEFRVPSSEFEFISLLDTGVPVSVAEVW